MYATKSNLQIAFEALDKSQRESFPYTIYQCGQAFTVLNDVFSPKYLPACELFAEKLPFKPRGSFLEVGTGIGVIAIMAAYAGVSRVVATDLSPSAVENTRQNIAMHGLSNVIDVRQGSIYEPLRPNEKFDLIFWNIPFLLVDPTVGLTRLQYAVADPGYRAADRFLGEGHRHLTPGEGRLMFGFSSTIGNFPILQQIASSYGIRLKLFHCEPNYLSQSAMHLEIFEACDSKQPKMNGQT